MHEVACEGGAADRKDKKDKKDGKDRKDVGLYNSQMFCRCSCVNPALSLL